MQNQMMPQSQSKHGHMEVLQKGTGDKLYNPNMLNNKQNQNPMAQTMQAMMQKNMMQSMGGQSQNPYGMFGNTM